MKVNQKGLVIFNAMKIKFNAPVTLTFGLICTLVLGLDQLTGGMVMPFFILNATFNSTNPFDYLHLFSYTMGHANWEHLIGNFSMILVLGPLLEEKYGSKNLLYMMGVTALVSAVLNILLFNNNVLGASGIVFMFILLSSFASFRQGYIPLTFVLVFILYIGTEVIHSFENDHISQFGHIMGGICGAFFGFFNTSHKSSTSDL